MSVGVRLNLIHRRRFCKKSPAKIVQCLIIIDIEIGITNCIRIYTILINIAVFLFYTLANITKSEKRRLLPFLLYTGVLAYAILAWAGFKEGRSLVNENFNLAMVNLGNLKAGLGKIPAILYEYQKQFFGFKKWNIVWILCVLVFLTGFKSAFSKNIKYVTAALLLFAAGYSAVYIFSAVDIKFFLHSTGSRFLLHILPVAVFWMALIVHDKEFIKE